FFSSRRRHTRWPRDWSSDVCSSDLSSPPLSTAADSVTYAAVLNGGEEYGNPRPGMIVAPIGDRYLAMQFTGSPQLWPRLLSVMRSEERRVGKECSYQGGHQG